MTIPRTESVSSRVSTTRASGLPESGSDRGQFVDVIDENASRCREGASESVEWSSGRPVVIFNFSIKAQVGRLMVAICSFGCVSTVDLTPDDATVADADPSRNGQVGTTCRGPAVPPNSRAMSNSFWRRREARFSDEY